MLMTIYKRALGVVLTKPFKLWGLSLLAIWLTSVLSSLCGIAIPVLGISVGLLISTSMTIIFLRGYRGKEINAKQIFFCFKDWQTIKRVLLGLGWMYLWIFLWSLIPIVGPIFAIIRFYEYRLTPYILVFEPEVDITDAIKVSSEKTKGYKLQMWLADFVYYIIFGVACLILGLFAAIPYIGILFTLILIVLFIAFAALAPLFAGLVQAAFYVEITNVANTCSGCGKRLPRGSEFCPFCGKSTK